MRNKFFDKYMQDLIDNNARKVADEVSKKVTDEVSKKVADEVSKDIACSLKGVLSDDLIAKHTGLSIEVVKKL